MPSSEGPTWASRRSSIGCAESRSLSCTTSLALREIPSRVSHVCLRAAAHPARRGANQPRAVRARAAPSIVTLQSSMLRSLTQMGRHGEHWWARVPADGHSGIGRRWGSAGREHARRKGGLCHGRERNRPLASAPANKSAGAYRASGQGGRPGSFPGRCTGWGDTCGHSVCALGQQTGAAGHLVGQQGRG